jgi:DNA-binding CsgD family transcriptional regulator
MYAQPVPDEYSRFIPAALAEVGVPAYVLDDQGCVRWLNEAAYTLCGDVVGQSATEVLDIDPGYARTKFARRLAGQDARDHSVVIRTADGRDRQVQISSVPLSDGHHAVGMFGLMVSREPRRERVDGSPLTPRQHEILVLLANGASTQAMAGSLVLSEQTVRNHVREVLRRLDTNSRLSAVAIARRDGLV